MFPQSRQMSFLFQSKQHIVTRLLHFWKLNSLEVPELTETAKQLSISPANTLKEFLGKEKAKTSPLIHLNSKDCVF